MAEPRFEIGGKISLGTWQDREAIRDLYARYAQAADDDDFDAWADTFAPDGSMDSPSHPSGRVTGREQLRAMVRGNSLFLRQKGIVKQRHINANLRISVQGESAWGTCNVLYYWLHPDGVTQLVGIGSYRDTLRKLEGEWRFERRDGSFDREPPRLPGVEMA